MKPIVRVFGIMFLGMTLWGQTLQRPVVGLPNSPQEQPTSQQDPFNQTVPPEAAPEQEIPSPQPVQEPITQANLPDALPPVVDYELDVALDPETKRVTGTLRLAYTNHSPDIIADLMFHTYLNAFKNNLSNYMIESGNTQGLPDENRAYCHVSNAIVNGEDLTSAMSYFHGPTSTPGDQTVLRIPLSAPLMPGETVHIQLEFQSKLPKAMERTGYSDSFFFLAQWYPKIGVWEHIGMRGAKKSGWNCRPYHYFTEYYANFGNYRVNLTTPADFDLGATGLLVREEELGEKKRVIFEQKNVHDFAIVAAKGLVRHEQVFEPSQEVSLGKYQETMAMLGLTREAVTLKPVRMIFLHPAEQKPDVERYFNALRIGLRELGLMLGAYPYETITMVNPPADARSAIGGMEYPALITLGHRRQRHARDYSIESLILHEFAHQYFYGLIASNEFEESFMDEGFTTYVADKLTAKSYGGQAYYQRHFGYDWPVSDWLGFQRLTGLEMSRSGLRNDGFKEPITTPSWAFYSRYNYGFNSYSYPALALEQLERELGWQVMARVLRQYANRFTYGHPSLREFQTIAEDVSGRELTWFFDAVFRNVGVVDYEALAVKSYDIRFNEGYTDTAEGPVLQDQSEKAENRVRQEVGVINRGTLVYPVTVEITFENGDVHLEQWSGDSRWLRLYYDDAPAITKVVVDPEKKLVLDKRLHNNTYVVQPDSKPQKRLRDRLLLGFQHLLQSVAWGF